jgi:hypothetical protein
MRNGLGDGLMRSGLGDALGRGLGWVMAGMSSDTGDNC